MIENCSRPYGLIVWRLLRNRPSGPDWFDDVQLDYYAEFRDHLQKLYSPLVREEETCVILDLRSAPTHRLNGTTSVSQWMGVDDGTR